MRKTIFTLLAAAGLLSTLTPAQAQSFMGLGSTGNTLSLYSSPGSVPTTYAITGLNASDRIVNIDYFVSTTGPLYGMSGSGTLYSLTQTGNTYTATVSGTANAIPGATVIDFNPAAQRLRVYAGTSNYRYTPGTGALTSDGTLAYASGDANFGTTPALTAAAYTNNTPNNGGATALFSLDSNLDILVANTVGPQFNSLTTRGTLTLGGNRFDITAATTGFDIRTVNGVDTAYLSSGNDLYTVNLDNAQLTLVGTQLGTNIIDLAFVPEPGTYALMMAGVLALAVVVMRRRQPAA